MKAPATTVLALSLMLAACNSKPEEPADASTETAQTTANVTAPAAPAAAMKPAPEGLPSRIAREVITASGQKCDGIAKAERQASDGTIVANCTGGETYRIYTEDGKGLSHQQCDAGLHALACRIPVSAPPEREDWMMALR